MTKLLEEFKSKLIGSYDNKQQAFSNPPMWSYINIRFDELSDELIHFKSWYNMNSESDPYRNTKMKLSVSGENVILHSNNSLESYEITFEYKNNSWVGMNEKCIILERNVYVSTFMMFDGINYYSRDAGYDLDSNKYIWGKTEQDGEFHFVKL